MSQVTGAMPGDTALTDVPHLAVATTATSGNSGGISGTGHQRQLEDAAAARHLVVAAGTTGSSGGVSPGGAHRRAISGLRARGVDTRRREGGPSTTTTRLVLVGHQIQTPTTVWSDAGHVGDGAISSGSAQTGRRAGAQCGTDVIACNEGCG